MTDPTPVKAGQTTIYKRRNNDGSVGELLAHFDKAGNLVLSGWDLGGAANAAFGRDDHEYWVVVARASVEQVLLELLREHYADVGSVSSNFMGFLDSIGVAYGFSTWTEEKAAEALQERTNG